MTKVTRTAFRSDVAEISSTRVVTTESADHEPAPFKRVVVIGILRAEDDRRRCRANRFNLRTAVNLKDRSCLESTVGRLETFHLYPGFDCQCRRSQLGTTLSETLRIENLSAVTELNTSLEGVGVTGNKRHVIVVDTLELTDVIRRFSGTCRTLDRYCFRRTNRTLDGPTVPPGCRRIGVYRTDVINGV